MAILILHTMRINLGTKQTNLLLVLSFLMIVDILALIYLPLYSYLFFGWKTIYLLDPFHKETSSHMSWVDFYNPPILFIILYLIAVILPFRLASEKMRFNSFKSVIIFYVAFPILFFPYIFLVPFFSIHGRTNLFPIVGKLFEFIRPGPAMIILSLTTIFRIVIEFNTNIKEKKTELNSNSDNRFFILLTFIITYTPMLIFYIHTIIWFSWKRYPPRIDNEFIDDLYFYEIANERIFILSSVFGGLLGILYSLKNNKPRNHAIIIMKSMLTFILVKLLLLTFYGLEADEYVFKPTGWSWWFWIIGGWITMYLFIVIILRIPINVIKFTFGVNNNVKTAKNEQYPNYNDKL